MAGITTTSEIAGPVNVVVQTSLLRNAKANCPYFVGSEPAEIAEHGGTFTAKWRRYENLTPTTTPLTELTGGLSLPTRTAVQPTVTDITATIQKYGNFMFMNEETDLINLSNQSLKLSEVFGINAGRSLNRVQRNELEDNATISLAGTATSAVTINTANMSLALIAVSNNALNNNDAMKFRPMTTGNTNIGTSPIRDAYWMLNHVDVTEDVRGLTGFNSVETYANQTEIAQGEYGSVGGMRCIESTESSIDLASGIAVTGTATIAGRSAGSVSYDLYNTVFFGKEAHGSVGLGFKHIKEIYTAGDELPGVQMISKPKGSAGSGDPLNEISTLGWKSWHVAKILNDTWIRTVRHTSSKLEI